MIYLNAILTLILVVLMWIGLILRKHATNIVRMFKAYMSIRDTESGKK